MVFECEDCGYSTIKKSHYLRHKNRKYPCHKTVNGNDLENNENIIDGQNVAKLGQNVAKLGQNVADSKLQCPKCKKNFKSNKRHTQHIAICNGINVLMCPNCCKVFETRDQKYKHKLNCRYVPFNQQNITINNITNNTTNNITNNNNIVQIVNVFGSEDLSYLSKDTSILYKLRLFGKSGIYGLSKIIDDVHFNKDRPENNTLIKPEEYGNGVMIMNDDKEWEFREFEDIRETLIDTVVKYLKAYNAVKNNLGVKLVEEKERNIIKNIAYELMALDRFIPRELFEELEMDEDNVEDNEEEIRNKIRKFDKSTLRNIHNRTVTNYKKENGNYIKKKLL